MNKQDVNAPLVLGFVMAALTVGCATPPGATNGNRSRHHLGKTLVVDETPRPIVSGEGVLHAYSRYAGAAVILVRSDSEPSQACAIALRHGHSIALPADRSVKVTMASDEIACVVGETPRGEIFWHTHAMQEDMGSLVASGR